MVTLKNIAEKTGFSLPTVSHILSKRDALYSEETRKKVVQAAEELGYRPNTSARAIRTGRFGTLALLMSSDPDRSGLFTPLVEGIHDELDQHNLHLSLARVPDSKLSDPDFVPRILKEWRADGMLMLYNSEEPSRLHDLIKQFSIPSIWLNAKQPSDAIYPDEFKAAYEATQKLLSCRDQPVYYCNFTHGIESPGNHFSVTDRRNGYLQAIEEAGKEPLFLGNSGRVEREDRLQFCRDWLGTVSSPVGVLASTPSSALPLNHAAATQNRAPGQDLSLITFCNSPLNETGISVASMKVPMYEMGRESVRMLQTKIEDPKKKLASTVLDLSFLPGETMPEGP